jgi:hypothetical protein
MRSNVRKKTLLAGLAGLILAGFSAAAYAQDTNGTFDGSSKGGPGSQINVPMPSLPPPPPTPPATPANP